MALSKERLKEKRGAALSLLRHEHADVRVFAEETLALIDELLERRERDAQEPVAWMQVDGDGVEYNGHNEFSGGGKGTPLYAAPPAPVVPPEKWVNPDIHYADENGFAEGWNACRAAMLKGDQS
ncbi:hypothetical protein [Pseudescherichia vulneris]|uniref:hypothetical protein n=1 Tax=Pseudescherichia vulneris TaxID=566 RepID=UPI0028AF0D36|nr:hypothetical protein [Pseudescherichia vulneris]